jgi:hypothetical protein
LKCVHLSLLRRATSSFAPVGVISIAIFVVFFGMGAILGNKKSQEDADIDVIDYKCRTSRFDRLQKMPTKDVGQFMFGIKTCFLSVQIILKQI